MPHRALHNRNAETFKASAVSPLLRGRLGIALLPGSTSVWDRTAQRMTSCTIGTCVGAHPAERHNGSEQMYINSVQYGGGRGQGMLIGAKSTALQLQVEWHE